MKESTRIVAKMIVDKHKPGQTLSAKASNSLTQSMLEYINASKSGMPSLIMEMNRRDV